MDSLPPDTKLTLFLWPEGMFPKQIVFYLFEKGLVTSTIQLYEGNTVDPRLGINIIAFESGGLRDKNPEDPRPAGKSTPCLRITSGHAHESSVRWVHESSAIRFFLEALYPEKPALITHDLINRATTDDIMGALQGAIDDGNNYIKNAASVTTFWSGLRDEERSLPVARNSKQRMIRALTKVQDWATPNLMKTGWLTPGLSRPGFVDVSLAAWARYTELSYSLDLFEDEGLKDLALWYARFKKLSWWDEMEERDRHPKELSYASDCREV